MPGRKNGSGEVSQEAWVLKEQKAQQERSHQILIDAGLSEEEMAELAFRYAQVHTDYFVVGDTRKLGTLPDGSTDYYKALQAYLDKKRK